jgi:hypothetical protein
MLCGTVYIVQAVAHKALPYLRAPYICALAVQGRKYS